MASGTVAVLCLADPLEDEDVAQLEFAPSRILPGNAVLAFATASAAARTVQELRARRPFVRAAIDMAEVFVDTQGRPTIDGLEVVDRALRWASAARSGELLLSDVARQLLDRTGTVECEPYDPDNGVYRVVATPQFHQLVPLPRLLASTDVHPFVNRYGPWLALERAWAASCTGERRVILIEGEAGSGKTRLAAEFARRVVTAGGIVLYGGSTESQELPFQPFGEALRPAFEALLQAGGSQPTEPPNLVDVGLVLSPLLLLIKNRRRST